MIREGKAEKFLYVPDTYDAGLREGDTTPVYIDGVDPAGSAAAVQGNLTAHEGLTGTAVHGLGTASLLTAGATGSSLVTSATVDGARGVLGLGGFIRGTRRVNHYLYAYTNTIVGSGTGVSSNTRLAQELATGTTPNSSVQRYVNETAGRLGLGVSGGGLDWSRLVFFRIALAYEAVNNEGIFRVIFGKTVGEAIGLPASGNYVAVTMAAGNITTLSVCRAGVLSNVATAPTAVLGGQIAIQSENGTVSLYLNSVLLGTTTNGPNVAATGSIYYEIQNGASATNYRWAVRSESEAF